MRARDEIRFPIPGYGGDYEITRSGRVWSVRSGRELKARRDVNGYLRVGLPKGGGRAKSCSIHRLLMLTFVGSGEGRVVRHLDGDKTNNALSNLAYGSQSENRYDTVRHGTDHHASRTACANGHEFTPENTTTYGNGRGRVCKTCRLERSRAFYARRRAA